MVNLMRVLREEGCAVSFLPDNQVHAGRYTRDLQAMGVECWHQPWIGGLPRWFAEHGRRFELVIASRHYVAEAVLPLVRAHAPQARLVFDTVDLHYLRERREAELAGHDPARLRAAERTRTAELALVRECDATLVVSPVEQALLAEETPGARVEVVSNVHRVAGPGRAFAERADLLFVGGYRHPPNVDAARWMVEDVLPRVLERLPGVRLHLVGSAAPPEVVALGERAGVVFHGFVEDIAPLMDGIRVGVAPLRYGAGVKGKVNLALAHGQPMVATRCAVEGMYLADGHDVLVADDAAGFADAIVRAYTDEALWRRLSANGLDNIERHFSFDAARRALRPLLD
jgi:glycosyltransferase involved in cell wall biosynthesis